MPGTHYTISNERDGFFVRRGRQATWRTKQNKIQTCDLVRDLLRPCLEQRWLNDCCRRNTLKMQFWIRAMKNKKFRRTARCAVLLEYKERFKREATSIWQKRLRVLLMNLEKRSELRAVAEGDVLAEPILTRTYTSLI